MKCPRDGTVLQKMHALGLELDKCHRCDGIWFDRDEFAKVRDAGHANIEEFFEWRYGDPPVEQRGVDGYMICPRCGGRLMSHWYTWEDPVRIDRCAKCFGLWLDDTEVNRIVIQKPKLDATVPGRALLRLLKAIATVIARKRLGERQQ